jgi:hypothetical protein
MRSAAYTVSRTDPRAARHPVAHQKVSTNKIRSSPRSGEVVRYFRAQEVVRSVADASDRAGSAGTDRVSTRDRDGPSMRGGQGFKSPQLHRRGHSEDTPSLVLEPSRLHHVHRTVARAQPAAARCLAVHAHPQVPEGVRGGTDRLAAGARGGAHLHRSHRLRRRDIVGSAQRDGIQPTRRTGSPNVSRQAGGSPVWERHLRRRLDASERRGRSDASSRALNRRSACRTGMAPAASWRCGARRMRPSARSLLVGAGNCYWLRSWSPRRPR